MPCRSTHLGLRSPVTVAVTSLLAAGCASQAPTSPSELLGDSPGAVFLFAQQCRTYATRYATQTVVSGIPDLHSTTSCVLSEFGATFTCTTTFTTDGCTIAHTKNDRYLNVSDFVASGEVLGRAFPHAARITARADGGPGCVAPPNADIAIEHDADRRVTGSTQTSPGAPLVALTYNSWDALGRPLAATMLGLTGPCGAQSLTYQYDDAGRTITTISAGGQASCGSSLISSFDAHLNLVEMRLPDSGYVAANTITESATVCR